MAGFNRIKGVQQSSIIQPDDIAVDVTPLRKRIVNWFKIPNNVVVTLMMMAGCAWYYSDFCGWIFLFATMLACWAMLQKEETPLKMPIQGKTLDANQPHPATNAPSPSQGIFFVGNDLVNGKEIWLTNDDCRQHFLILGTTGAGKTETLLGFAANALSWGSGFLFCDGKGDVALFAKVYAMARRFGREDDLLVLNFMTGNKDLGASGGELLSNTLNPFSNGSSDGLTQMVVSLMDDVGGDGAMWKGRATAMLTGVMRALCWLRDRGYMDLNVSEIRDYMSLKKIIDLADESKHPDLPSPIRKSIRSYLTSLPGFQEEKKEKQAQTTLDQHGYLEMQFTKILGSLADVYGHIFATPYGEVDMYDVVLGRRILVIMLPALEKAGDEIANLGKIVVATLKGMMGATLGSKLEGSWDDVVENRATNSPSPFLVILDEVGYYTVEGMALMAAQARSLGFSMCYASQDVNAMKRNNEKEAASIIANTNTKIFMKMEDPDATADLALKRAGKATRVRAGGYDRKIGELSGSYAIEGENASLEDVDVIHLSDLTGQLSGEMHVISGSKTIRAKGFYAQPEGGVDKKKLKLRANHFIKVARPSMDTITISSRGPEIMLRLMNANSPVELASQVSQALAAIPAGVLARDEISIASTTFDKILRAGRKPHEASCAAVADVMRTVNGQNTQFSEEVRGSYAAQVPAGPANYDLNDFDDDIADEGFTASAAKRRGTPSDIFEDDDPFGMPGGIPISSDKLPPFPPARNAASAKGFTDSAKGFAESVRKPQRVEPNVRHGATVNNGGMIDMADRIASNDAIMKSLAALEFDSDQVTPQQVETRMEQALGGVKGSVVDAIAAKVESFDRSAGAIQDTRSQNGRPTDATKTPSEPDEGEGEYLVDFLEGLLGNNEDE